MKRLVTLGSVVAFMLVGACGKKPSKAPKAPAFTVTAVAAEVAADYNFTTPIEVVFTVKTADKVLLENLADIIVSVPALEGCCEAKEVAAESIAQATVDAETQAVPASFKANLTFKKEGTYTVTVKGIKVKGAEKATEVTTTVKIVKAAPAAPAAPAGN